MPPRKGLRVARLAGFDVRLSASAALLPVWLALFAVRAAQPGAPNFVPALLGAWCALVAHETGHALVARLRGLPVEAVVVGGFGGAAWIGVARDREPRPADEWLPALGGPLANAALCAALLAYAAASGRALVTESVLAAVEDAFTAFLAAQALFAVVNLAPALPADGGRVVRGLLRGVLSPAPAAGATAALGLAFAATLVAAGALVEPTWAVAVLLGAGAVFGAFSVLELRRGRALAARGAS